ncbi:MAG: ABC transporter ATP-binding protein [Thermoprotei archaeon]|nr:MAG: ABC transporter ATP-binding protein [Thermoprotei archaeon]RLF00668.1 MAG: ABC transporter ATP-binding protein [Thermoprotei archaeon]HDI75300.1 ABC transporter ATP-binding protein [Thermoprotei archaeon]
MVVVRLKNVSKRFGKVVAVDDVTLEIKEGEFFTFLGPSGCGKTTTLRIIAGLEYPDKGRIFFDDEDVTDVPPYKRNTGMVFQNYALWPHMTVFENISYGLKIRGYSKHEIKKKVDEVLELVQLKGLENRYPTQLSGGQQQRVALARALVIEPKVLLLDEPLSNLDARLRVEMREELKRLQKELKITTIYVTHDQEEALVISDRIAVMRQGRIMQVGEPDEVYRRPKNLFVATFLGRCSLIEGKVVDVDKDLVTIAIDHIRIKGVLPDKDMKLRKGEEAYAVLKPEDFALRIDDPSKANEFTGTVEWLFFVGPFNQIRLGLGRISILVNVEPWFTPSLKSKVTVYIPYEYVIILPKKEQEVCQET